MDGTNFSNINDFLLKLHEFLSHTTKIFLSTHQNADLDGFSSAIALGYWINKVFPKIKVNIIIPGANKIVKRFYEEISAKFEFKDETEIIIDRCETLILVDVNDLALSIQLKPSLDAASHVNIQNLIIIDHHKEQLNYQIQPTLSLIDDHYPSTAELILELFQSQKIDIPLILAELLLMGIISDTGHFKYASQDTFLRCANLLENSDVHLGNIFDRMNIPITISERIARLKAGKRIHKIHQINEYLLVVSHLSSFEASGCNALLNIGADLSFIVHFTDKNGNFRISGRARNSFIQETSFHIGNLLQQIGNEFGGSGGGHSGAGGCYGILKQYNKNKKEHYIRILSDSILSHSSSTLNKSKNKE